MKGRGVIYIENKDVLVCKVSMGHDGCVLIFRLVRWKLGDAMIDNN